MADTKISALPAATTPLAGTEVLPIVQGGTTDKVTVENLTAGRSVSMLYLDVLTAAGLFGNLNSSNANGGYLRWQTNGTSIADIGSTKQVFGTGSANDFGIGTRAGYYLGLGANGAESLRLTTNGDASVLTGNLVIGTSGKGIDFSATPGTGTSELLNDYEEGTWTPTGSGITLAAAEGRYVKIGQQVTCWFFIQFPITADTGNAVITGLPFTVRSGSNVGRGGGAFGFRSDAGLANLTLISNDGVTDLQFRLTSGGTGSDSTRPSNSQLSTLIFIGSIAYLAAA